MTIGIYILRFKGTDKVYIGQSVDIYNRFSIHKTALRNSSHTLKLQKAYDDYGEPSLEILCEVSKEDLNTLEKEAIDIFDSVSNGFNTLYNPGIYPPGLSGEESPVSLYSNEVYEEILRLLASTTYSVLDISELLNVSKNVVYSIRQLSAHLWLKEVFPEYYQLIEQKYKSLKRDGNTRANRGKPSLTVVSDITGDTYLVTSIKEFCKVYSLDNGNVSNLLNNKILYYKGWRLDTTPKKLFPVFISPSGEVHNLLDKSVSAFSLEHGLESSSMSKLLKGSIPQYKGWRKFNE